MRSSIAMFLVSAICYGCVAHSEVTDSKGHTTVPPATTSSVSLQTCIWTWSSDGSTEFRYVVDLDKEKAGAATAHRTLANPPDCARLRVERKKRDAGTYARVVERFNDQRGRSGQDETLAGTIQWIEESTKWGASRANWIVASPDGAYAVFSAHGKPLLLIDVATLGTRVLAKVDPYLNLATPVAWTPDSRHVAFAPQGTDKVHIYSIEHQAVVSTKTGAGPWVETLSWSPDMQRIAAFGFVNRRMNKTPLGLLWAAAGHPEFRNDGVLSVYRIGDDRRFSVVLKRGISEMGSANIEIEWK